MSQQTLDSEASTQDPILSRLNAQFNEEKLLKDLSSVQLAKFKAMDELTAEIRKADNFDELRKVLEENLGESPSSLISRYVIGIIGLEEGNLEDMAHVRGLLEDFRKSAKWPIVDHIADRMLSVDENNRIALRAKVESTERLKGKKELKPYLEKLASIDRKNPDIVKKYALSILADEPEKARGFLKQAGETYARIKDYKNLEEIWNLMVQHDYEDMPFFERVERVLVGNREKTRVAAYFVTLLEPYRAAENWPQVINILKKILEYEPTSTRARSDLVRAYRQLYSEHSLLDDFLKMSDLTNNKKPVGPCIAQFERNIVFDQDNYVYHRTRGVGKMTSIDKEQAIIDFRDNPGQRMSIQMAISSLKPLGPDHIWVRSYENPDEIKELFKEDVPLFFEALLSSFGYKMTLAEIKAEVSDVYLKADEWSKWWSRARTQLKKDPKFGFNPRKKDELHLRDTPMTLSEELTMKFQSLTDWNKKLELAAETLKDPDTEDAAELCVQFYREQLEKNKDLLKKLHCFFFLEAARAAMGDDDAPITSGSDEVQKIFKNETHENLVTFCQDTTVVDFKREIINRIIKTRDDYPAILKDILFELPIKVNRYIVTELNRLGNHDTLNEFIDRAFAKFRDNPEIFMWTARSILTGQWSFDWLQRDKEEVVLLVFRLLKPLARIEKKGTRLKNMAIETLFGSTNITSESVREGGALPEILPTASSAAIRRMSALFREVPYIPDAHKENLTVLIQELRPDFASETETEEDDSVDIEDTEPEAPLIPAEGVILVTQAGFEKRKADLDHLINVEMPANSRDIGEAQEKGDLRENAEYKAAMEKQSQLQAEIKNVDNELKKAEILDPSTVRTDVVSIGTTVTVKESDGNVLVYTILSSWEANSDQNIISYLSPLGKSFIGKKPGETASLDSGRSFEIQDIKRAEQLS